MNRNLRNLLNLDKPGRTALILDALNASFETETINEEFSRNPLRSSEGGGGDEPQEEDMSDAG